MTDRPILEIGDVSNSALVREMVEAIFRRFAPLHDLSNFRRAFDLMQAAFAGDLPGYAELKTGYHNASHTNEVVLCTARMLHGLHLAGHALAGQYLDAALIGALLHDSGYLMRDDEHSAASNKTGAQFTATHVLRGVEFARKHLVFLDEPILDSVTKVIQVTDHRQHPDWVQFDHPQQQLAAYATATADLVGQMANRQYLERLILLFFEFQEAEMGGFRNFHELLEKTSSFYQVTRQRLEQDLDNLSSVLKLHFSDSLGQDRNFYVESIERNLAYLEQLVQEGEQRRLEMLKRGGVVDRLRGTSDAG